MWYGNRMAPHPPLRLSRSERQERIERAALRLFARQGFAATTVEDVVQAAGLTKPMLYRHFESKQELCVALLERARAELIAAPMAHFAPGSEDRSTLVSEMIDAWLGHIEADPDAARLLFTPITGDPEVERVQRELHALQIATQIALLREFVPGLRDVDAEPVGELLRASLAAVALWWLDRPEVPREVPAGTLARSIEGIYAAFSSPGRRQ